MNFKIKNTTFGNGEQTMPAEATKLEAELFDLDGTMQRLGGNRSLLADLIQLYDEDSPQLLDRIDMGVKSLRCDEVRRAAHSLRGLAANFGAAKLAEPLFRLEAAASQGHLEDAAALAVQIRNESGRLQTTLAPYNR